MRTGGGEEKTRKGERKKREVVEWELGGGLISLSLSFIRSRAERGSRLYRRINTV